MAEEDEGSSVDPEQKVCVLIIEQRHGRDVSVARDQTCARKLLYDYVKEWWGDGYDLPPDCPEEANEAINLYFSEAGRPDETYEIVEDCLVES